MGSSSRRVGPLLESFSSAVSRWAGGTTAFALALSVVAAWLISGPIFGFSDTWQLVINTGTTIVTFLMVFLIQRAQNKDAMAIQLKLNELVAALSGASNSLIDVEDLTEDELKALHHHYARLAQLAQRATNISESHSPQRAALRHQSKRPAKSRQRQH